MIRLDTRAGDEPGDLKHRPDCQTMLFQYWSSVCDAGPTLKQHCCE